MFCIAASILCVSRPHAARIFVGVFFIIMAVGVNVVLTVLAPDQFIRLGDEPLLPFYGWVFQNVFAPAPHIVGILAAAGEIGIGLLILSRGRSVKLGLAGAIAFLIVITPLGIWTLPNPVLAGGLAWLLKEEYPRSVLDLLRSRRHRKVTKGTAI
ncbi:hypothetical protein [Pseudarthrobacter sp. DSP2-3-2b1]|uniref:hypothetical protein n=1 Tax=Pseudarthrobacter sp. DSP2-3-2b1 TaxID=2804661 RepID=UPI003CF3BC65